MSEADSLLNLADQGDALDALTPHLSNDQKNVSPHLSVLESIADYSPDWSYTEVMIVFLFRLGCWKLAKGNH